LIARKAAAISDGFVEGEDYSDKIIEFHQMLCDLMEAKGIEIPEED
jgi:hypothetical protein